MTSVDKKNAKTEDRTQASQGDNAPVHVPPAAGAHAALHLTNEDATPGSGALTSRANASGKEVDGGAG